MYCRGRELIKQICKNRNIEPVVYLKLLNRQHMISDANGENLNDSYVLFKYINKNTPNKTDTIRCRSVSYTHLVMPVLYLMMEYQTIIMHNMLLITTCHLS